MKFELNQEGVTDLDIWKTQAREKAAKTTSDLAYYGRKKTGKLGGSGLPANGKPRLTDELLSRRAYAKPPSGFYSDWSQFGRHRDDLFAHIDEQYAHVLNPSSEVEPAPHGWKMELRSKKTELDPLTQALFDASDLYLCRFVFKVLEGEDEQVRWIKFSVEHRAGTVYRMWPSKQYRVGPEVKATAQAKLGVATNLDFIPVSAEASAGLVWTAEWR